MMGRSIDLVHAVPEVGQLGGSDAVQLRLVHPVPGQEAVLGEVPGGITARLADHPQAELVRLVGPVADVVGPRHPDDGVDAAPLPLLEVAVRLIIGSNREEAVQKGVARLQLAARVGDAPSGAASPPPPSGPSPEGPVAGEVQPAASEAASRSGRTRLRPSKLQATAGSA
jgi:hypothetical protein